MAYYLPPPTAGPQKGKINQHKFVTKGLHCTVHKYRMNIQLQGVSLRLNPILFCIPLGVLLVLKLPYKAMINAGLTLIVTIASAYHKTLNIQPQLTNATLNTQNLIKI